MDTKPLPETLHESNEAGVSLLISDAEIALTLLDSAEISSDAASRLRRVREARKAYDSIHHLLHQLTLDAAQSQVLNERMTMLRRRLIRAGALED